MIAILRLTDIETYFIKYLGITPLNINSLPLKSRKVDVFQRSTIVAQRLSRFYYSDVVGKFLLEESNTKISFEAIMYSIISKVGSAGLQNIKFSRNRRQAYWNYGRQWFRQVTLLSGLTDLKNLPVDVC